MVYIQKDEKIVKKERNYWPHAIFGIIISVVIAGAWTVKIALDNPVQEDTYFMDKYQYVDTNINKLLEKKAKFDAKYRVELINQSFVVGKNSIQLKIEDKSTMSLPKNAKIELLITRPETNEYNQKLSPSGIKENMFVFNEVEIPKIGRWQILVRSDIDEFEGFNKFEVNATK